MSAQPCGCDPEANNYHCENYPKCAWGKFVYLTDREKDTTPPKSRATLPDDPKERKTYPIYSGVLAYFPDAIAEVAHVSYVGNQQHNPGQPLHWAREKSTDQEDCEIRHLMEKGKFDKDGCRHSGKRAWRALASLQLEIEADRKREEEAA